ncbi:PREDICTED: solute carrier organic anion transporter family member 1A2 [Galeopterus variegatus]|uniref:Solute carrier organic anion transporter family member n=1 Tax=Galeopterus variegatus TaxID=482537 RepID=A0ABM0RUQ8_GALVR|nr:PREDICTED: solute carrier organic anion transporter family member 1A2 [Galeopterus variegatus]
MGETEKKIETRKTRCLSKMKIFLLALTCAFVSKVLSGAYTNSMLTQIERQFNLPTSLVGFINGSFEIGNLVLIIFVSYFGTKLHRPVIIGVGCVVMGLGCFLQALPHFLMNRYEYESTVSISGNLSSNNFLCMENGTQIIRPTQDPSECVKEVKSLMWVCVLIGNTIRGMGETPIMPLGISYIEDFAKSENSPLYIGVIKTGAIIGLLVGLLLGSFCANIYVDTGFVNTDELTITPSDTRWVGAWWFGFLICAGVNVLTAVPFFFLPKTLPKEGLEDDADITKNDKEEKQREEAKKEKDGLTKDFLPFMKSLSCNSIYMLFIILSVVQVNAFASSFSFLPKYLEQQYGKSASDAVFLVGIYNIPPICVGYIVGGLIMKKFKITVKQAAHIGFWLSLSHYLLHFLCFLMICDNSSVAGITISYEGIQQGVYTGNNILADCNTACSCPTKTWDPVCGDNGLSYMSACLAGCKTSVGTGINMVFHNCSCIQAAGHSSAVLGLCGKGHDCSMMLQYFLILMSVNSFIYSLAAIPGFMVLLRCIKPEEKSLGVGLHAFCMRILGKTVIFPNITLDQYIYLGLPAALRGSSFIPALVILILLRKHHLPGENASSETEFAETKVTGKENECKDIHQNSKLLNDGELKIKL